MTGRFTIRSRLAIAAQSRDLLTLYVAAGAILAAVARTRSVLVPSLTAALTIGPLALAILPFAFTFAGAVASVPIFTLPFLAGERGVAALPVNSRQGEAHVVDLACAERRAISNGRITHRLEFPGFLLRGLAIRQRTKKQIQILVPVAYIPAFVAYPQAADINAAVLGLEVGGVEQPELGDGLNRIDDRLGVDLDCTGDAGNRGEEGAKCFHKESGFWGIKVRRA